MQPALPPPPLSPGEDTYLSERLAPAWEAAGLPANSQGPWRASLLQAVADGLLTLRAGEAGRANARRLLLDLDATVLADLARTGEPGPSALGHALALVSQRSDYLTESAAQDASCLSLVAQAARGRSGDLAEAFSRRDVARELETAAQLAPDGKPATEATFHDAVARLVRRTMVRVGLRDIFHLAEMPAMMREISDLSELVLRAAMAWFERLLVERHGRPMEVGSSAGASSWGADSWSAISSPFSPQAALAADAAPSAREAAFCVVTMGKGGGRELNYSSDVDLVFVYSGEGETTGVEDAGTPGRRVRQLGNHAYFNRLAEQIIGFLTRPGPGGAIYRVDMRLRPEGAHGPLARSLASFRDYFAEQALAWERVAYAKARAIAGPRLFRDEVERAFGTFVFAEIFNTEILAGIGALKRRIDRQAEAMEHKGLDIKRGHGGIREIEFLLVALQLLYSNDVPELRNRRSTLGLLDALAQAGILPLSLGDRLRRDYLFLRHLEQRLQLLANRQTHLLPSGPTPQARQDYLRRVWDAPEELDRTLAAVRRHVEEEFRLLFHEEKAPVPEAMPLLQAVLDEGAPEDSLLPLLEAYRLRDRSSVAVLRRLATGTREVYTTRRDKRFFEAIFAALMNVAARVPYPDAALRHFEDFLRRARASGGLFELLAEYPRTIETILRTTGHGDWLATLLSSQPEYLDELLSPETLSPELTERDDFAALTRRLATAKTLEKRQRVVRRYRAIRTLGLGVRHVLQLDPWPVTAAALSRLAGDTLRASLPYCVEDPELYLKCVEAGFCVLALGKLSLGELSWFSDLDVVFATESCEEEGARLASALIEFLSKPTSDGVAYEVDARLRPMGRTAPLVPTRETILPYFEQTAETWEFLAFTRVTQLAGNSEQAARIVAGIGESYTRLKAASLDSGPEGIAAQTASMRQRMEASVGKQGPGSGINLKRGRGGIVDLEFARQASTLAGLARGDLKLDARRPTVLEGMDRVGGGDPALKAAWSANYAELRRIEASNRLLRGDGKDIIPGDPTRLEALAFALGEGDDPQGLLDRVAEMLEANRMIFERTMANLAKA